MERESMVFYKSFLEATDNLEPEMYKKVMRMIIHYGIYGETLKGDVIESAIFSLIKPQIDANNRRYANGKQGGRKSNQDETKVEPKPNQTITKGKPNHNQDETKVEPNVNDNVNDNANVNDLKDINSRAGTTTCAESDNESVQAETKGEPHPEQAKKPKKAKETKADTEATEVIEYLNAKTGSSYRATTEANIKPIRARINDGFSVEDCKKVIDIKAGQWLNTEQSKYLRPETLFRPSKFEGYLNECRGKPSIRGDSPPVSEQAAFNQSISDAIQRQMFEPVENPVTDEMLDALGIK